MGYLERKKERFTNIYREYKTDVYKVCRSIIKDDAAASEMMQQTFMNFYEHSDESKVNYVRGYLIRSARNLCYNAIRDSKREVAQESWDAIESDEYTVISVEEVYFREEQKRQEERLKNDILECLRKENESWYMAVNLLFVLGKPHDVVADEMGISKEALYSLLYRARKWIYKKFSTRLEEIKQVY